MNKRSFLIGLFIFQLTLLSACFGKNWIDQIKTGALQQYDKVKSVGEVFDGWASCQAAEWAITSQSDDSAEVQYTCNVKDVDKLVSNLKEKQKRFQADNVVNLKELERSIQYDLASFQVILCETDLFIDKMNEGYITRKSDSAFTDNELKEAVKKYRQILTESVEKAKNNSFKDDSEPAEYHKELSGIWDPVQNQFNSVDLFSQGNVSQLNNNKNASYKKIQEKLIGCIKNIDLSNDDDDSRAEDHIVRDERRVGDFGSYGNLSTLFIAQKEFDSYSKVKNFDAIKQIKAIVVFGATKETFEVKSSYLEFLIGEGVKQVPYTHGDMVNAIYKNEIFADTLIEGNVIDEVAKQL